VSHDLDESVEQVAASIGKRFAGDVPVSAEEFVNILLVEYPRDLDLFVRLIEELFEVALVSFRVGPTIRALIVWLLGHSSGYWGTHTPKGLGLYMAQIITYRPHPTHSLPPRKNNHILQ